MRTKLTRKIIERLPPHDRQYTVYDSEEPHLLVWVNPSGRKTYAVRYRSLTGQRHSMALGPTSAMPPTEARKAARQILARVARGENPLEDRRKASKRGMTLVELWGEYQRGYLDHPRPASRKGHRPLSPRTRAAYRWYWNKYLEPALGKRRIDTITRTDIERLHAKLGECSATNANRTLALVGSMYSFAEHSKILPQGSNPTHGVLRFEEKRRQRFLSNEELRRLGAALRAVEGKEPWQAIAAIRLLLGTGARRSEVLSMQWEDIDLERMTWHLPHSKTGARTVFLNGLAAEVLLSLPRLEGCPWVLPGKDPANHFKGLPHPWERIRKTAGLEDVRLHDLRHTAASVALAGGASLEVIQILLGHRELRTTERYAHLAGGPVRLAAERLGETLAAALDDAAPAEVVPGPGAGL